MIVIVIVVLDGALDVIATAVDDIDDPWSGRVDDQGGAQLHGAVKVHDHVDATGHRLRDEVLVDREISAS